MLSPGLAPPNSEVTNFDVRTSTTKTAALAVDVAGIGFATLLFTLRMFTRHVITGRYGIDDITCVVAYIGFIGYCTIGIVMIMHGGGLNQWNVPEREVVPFSKAVYSTMVIYGPTVFATKASILFFLTRVFAPYERYCRFVYAFTLLMGCYYILMLVLKIFVCRPIHKFWDPAADGQCFNQRALILADNVISLISDIAVLLIPCPLAQGLRVAAKAKFRIAAVFGAGGVACVCSFIRLIDIIKLGASTDQTFAFTLINLWGVAEVGTGLVCACFPVLPAFWKYLRNQHPSQLQSSGRGDSSYGRGTVGRSRTQSNGGIELAKKKIHHFHSSRSGGGGGDTTITTTNNSTTDPGGGGGRYSGSAEDMLIPRLDSKMTTSVRGGAEVGVAVPMRASEDLEMGKGGMREEGRGGKQSYDDQGIVRTVEVQMMREPK